MSPVIFYKNSKSSLSAVSDRFYHSPWEMYYSQADWYFIPTAWQVGHFAATFKIPPQSDFCFHMLQHYCNLLVCLSSTNFSEGFTATMSIFLHVTISNGIIRYPLLDIKPDDTCFVIIEPCKSSSCGI